MARTTHRARARGPRPGRLALAVRARMRARGLTVVELSGMADITRSSLSSWLNGRRGMSVAKFERVLRGLDCLEAVADTMSRC